MLSMRGVGSYQGNEVTRSWTGNACSQSYQLAETLWNDPGLQSGISASELISTLKKKKMLMST